jgi:hypothetical protein
MRLETIFQSIYCSNKFYTIIKSHYMINEKDENHLVVLILITLHSKHDHSCMVNARDMRAHDHKIRKLRSTTSLF